MSVVPKWWQGPPGTWGATAAQATGMVTYVKVPWTGKNGKQIGFRMEKRVVPVPEQFKNLVIPWQYVGKNLPVGAFTSLFPNAKGNDWSGVKPDGFGPGWLPPGPLNPDGWDS